jgi:hypothetical protein
MKVNYLRYNSKKRPLEKRAAFRWDRDQQMQDSLGQRSPYVAEYRDQHRCER